MTERPGSGRGGLFTATRSVAATLLATGRTRFELLGNEIKEEKLRAVRLLLLSQAMAFCLAVGMCLAIALLVVLFWDNRAALLGCFSALFLTVSALCYFALRRAKHTPERLFAASMAELEEDLRQLKGTAGDESRSA